FILEFEFGALGIDLKRRRQWQGGFAFETGQLNPLANQLPDYGLLHLHALVGVNHTEIELRAHRQVLLENAPLKDAKALVLVGGQPQIHARFKEFQLRPPIQDAVQRHFQISLEEERQVGQRGEIVNAAYPRRRAPAHDIAPKSRKDIPIA